MDELFFIYLFLVSRDSLIKLLKRIKKLGKPTITPLNTSLLWLKDNRLQPFQATATNQK
jgi:hypothetical protein